MQRRTIRAIATAAATVLAAGIFSLTAASTSWAATGFSATNISGGATASALSTTHAVFAREHLVCGGHPTNVVSVTFNGNENVFRVSPVLPVAGGHSITCIAG